MIHSVKQRCDGKIWTWVYIREQLWPIEFIKRSVKTIFHAIEDFIVASGFTEV